MSQQQLTILSAIRDIHRTTYAPVPTVAVAVRCYMSPAWARRLLGELARQGAIDRIGQRRGWMPKGI